MLTKPAKTTQKIHDIMQNRWSPRAFDAHKPIAEETLLTLLEAAHWAPSCMNEQPWRFVVCAKTLDRAAWQSMYDCLAEKNQIWAQHAPVFILSVAVKDFLQNAKPNRWSAYDTGAASLSLCLQATALGLITHQMGGFDSDQCRNQFNIPINCTPMSVIALGYQAEAGILEPEFKQKEMAERSRAEFDTRFYFGRWI